MLNRQKCELFEISAPGVLKYMFHIRANFKSIITVIRKSGDAVTKFKQRLNLPAESAKISGKSTAKQK